MWEKTGEGLGKNSERYYRERRLTWRERFMMEEFQPYSSASAFLKVTSSLKTNDNWPTN